MTYRINWIKTWKVLSIYFTLTITFGITLIELIKYVKSGFSSEANFQNTSLGESLVVVILICVSGAAFMFFLAWCMSLYKITINKKTLSGRNIYFIKRNIPFTDIISMEYYSINGVTGVEVASRTNGKVFIPTQAYNFEALINLIIENSPYINAT